MTSITQTEKKYYYKGFESLRSTKFSNKPNVYTIYDKGSAYSTTKSISCTSIEEGIAIFALNQTSQTAAIAAWHFSSTSSYDKIMKEFNNFSSMRESQQVYLVGGLELTTDGKNCLLHNINLAVASFFISKPEINRDLIYDPDEKSYHGIDANLELDGTLTVCHY